MCLAKWKEQVLFFLCILQTWLLISKHVKRVLLCVRKYHILRSCMEHHVQSIQENHNLLPSKLYLIPECVESISPMSSTDSNPHLHIHTITSVLSLSLSLSLSLFLTQTHSLSLSHTHLHSISLSHTHTHMCTHTHTHTCTHTQRVTCLCGKLSTENIYSDISGRFHGVHTLDFPLFKWNFKFLYHALEGLFWGG